MSLLICPCIAADARQLSANFTHIDGLNVEEHYSTISTTTKKDLLATQVSLP